jgi:hypothetical protein
MDPRIYLIGISISALGILTVVWISAITSRRTETREKIRDLIAQTNVIIRLIIDSWLDEDRLAYSPKNDLAIINQSLHRYRLICNSLSDRLKGARVPEDVHLKLIDWAGSDIEDRADIPEQERRKKFIQIHRKMTHIIAAFESEHEHRKYKLTWW